MSKHFSIFVSPRSLANAASFLKSQGTRLRSRNQLVSLCISYVEELAKQDDTCVASDDREGEDFLLREGLGGKAEKDWTGKPVKENYQALVRQVVANVERDKKLGIQQSWTPPPVTAEDVLKAARDSVSQGESLSDFRAFARAAFDLNELPVEVEELFKEI